jgi:hypothetical protein
MSRLAVVRCAGVAAALAFAVSTRPVQAHEPNIISRCLYRLIPKTDPASDHNMHRAGHPDTLACYTASTKCGPYTGSYVGGSCAFKGCARNPDEGTWGWDYCGPLHSEHPWLKWCHGRRCQGGPGAYKSDGPHVPDPIAKLGI